MAKALKFMTGSSYHGFYNFSLNCMEGFGCYSFPDGSHYSGYFKRGKFNGPGRIHLVAPYKFTFIGQFVDGRMIKLDEMMFDDGVRVQAQLKDYDLIFDRWRYCSEVDRRLAKEIALGLEPVNLEDYLTVEQSKRVLRENWYDTGEGVFGSKNNFIVDAEPPFSRTRFVGCDREREWIIDHCRKGPSRAFGKSYAPEEPKIEVCRKILDVNRAEMPHSGACTCHEISVHKTYLMQLCKMKIQKDEVPGDESDSYFASGATTPSRSSSFCDKPLYISNLRERCHDEVRDLKMEESSDRSEGTYDERIFDELRKQMWRNSADPIRFGSLPTDMQLV